jgi:subfamily B ATP-binding cassette protein MsbA
VRRLLGYLKPARWHFAGGVLAGLVYAAASGVGLPTMIYVVTPVIFGETVAAPAETKPEGSAFPCAAESNVTSDPAGTGGKSSSNLDKRAAAQQQLAEWSKRFFGPDYRDKLLLVACLAMPLVFLIRGLASFLNRYWLNHAGFQMLEAMRADVFRRLQDLPLEFYHRHKTGDLTARLMTDTEQLKGWVITMSGDILKQPFTLLGALGFLGYLAATNRSAVFVLITLASVPACILPIRLVARRII